MPVLTVLIKVQSLSNVFLFTTETTEHIHTRMINLFNQQLINYFDLKSERASHADQ